MTFYAGTFATLFLAFEARKSELRDTNYELRGVLNS